MTIKKMITEILDEMDRLMRRYLPDVKPEDLVQNGNTFYMNGNDGTDFDWNANGRTCEFMRFYEKTEYGAIKAYIRDDGNLDGYIWGNDGLEKGTRIDTTYSIGCENAKELCKWLIKNKDDKEMWDEVIYPEFIGE